MIRARIGHIHFMMFALALLALLLVSVAASLCFGMVLSRTRIVRQARRAHQLVLPQDREFQQAA